jgi:hypothetical protein
VAAVTVQTVNLTTQLRQQQLIQAAAEAVAQVVILLQQVVQVL